MNRIFIADDDTDDIEFFNFAVKAIFPDIIIDPTQDGVELMQQIKLIKKSIPDVIFLDVNMPRKNGFECMDAIKSNPVIRDVPVVILTTASADTMVCTMYDMGANYFITKPSSISKLQEAITLIMQTGLNNRSKAAFHIKC